jgi:hypothetical protein
MAGNTLAVMRAFIQFFASWGLSDAIVGVLTLLLTFAFNGDQKPFNWLALCILGIGAIFWWLVIGLTFEIAPKEKDIEVD